MFQMYNSDFSIFIDYTPLKVIVKYYIPCAVLIYLYSLFILLFFIQNILKESSALPLHQFPIKLTAPSCYHDHQGLA